jgi:release factor glutamine methyltransferase
MARDEELWTIMKVLGWTQGRFAERGLSTPRLDAEVLLAHVLGRDRVGLYTHFDQPLAGEELARFRELIKRRLGGESVAYLVGHREFRSLDLAVDARVLVPRPDTETLVEAALALLPPPRAEAPRVVDVGTGSGAIAIAIAVARPDVTVEAVDRSPDAAEVARANAARHAPAVVVHVGDLLGPVEGPIDLVVSNPPYIPSGEIAGLPAEVQREPRLALDGGADGLEVVRRLVAQAVPRLVVGGALAIEIGQGQAGATAALFAASGLVEIARHRDLGGVERVVTGRRG